MKRIVAALMLVAFPCYAQVAIPEDAPVILSIQEGELVVLDSNDQPVKAKVNSGFYLNKPAAKELTGALAFASKEINEKTDKVNELNEKVADLESKKLTPGLLVLIIGGSFLLGAGTAGAVVGVAVSQAKK